MYCYSNLIFLELILYCIEEQPFREVAFFIVKNHYWKNTDNLVK